MRDANFCVSAKNMMASFKKPGTEFRDDKSGVYHALYGCREVFYETVKYITVINSAIRQTIYLL